MGGPSTWGTSRYIETCSYLQVRSSLHWYSRCHNAQRAKGCPHATGNARARLSRNVCSAPVSALFPTLPDRVDATGTLCILWVRYGSNESRTRQICVFLSERINFKTDPGLIARDGDLLAHRYGIAPKEGDLREPLRDDLTGTYVNA